VIEELMGTEIVDETDRFLDHEKTTPVDMDRMVAELPVNVSRSTLPQPRIVVHEQLSMELHEGRGARHDRSLDIYLPTYAGCCSAMSSLSTAPPADRSWLLQQP
jgi:hypothetical protein